LVHLDYVADSTESQLENVASSQKVVERAKAVVMYIIPKGMTPMTQLIAFHADAGVKEKYLTRVRRHREADQLIRGRGWDGSRGCAVGCTLEKYDHASYETELGVPAALAHLEDFLFERMPIEAAMAWPERFLAAISPGASLSMVAAHWTIWLLEEELCRWASDASRVVVALYRRRIAGDEPSAGEWAEAAEGRWAAAAEEAAEGRWAAAGQDCCLRMADMLIELLQLAPVL
jgi:hypothetical protein